MKRAAESPELIDGPLDDLDELAGNLRDLRTVNALLWGASLSVRAVRALAAAAPAEEHIAILDVGTGAADIPLALLRDASRRDASADVLAVDSREEVLEAARRLDPSVTTTRGLTLRVSDGRSLPFADGSFDIAHASLVVHHLEPADATALLAELDRVSRLGIVVNDVLRSRLNLLGAQILARIATRNRMSRNDGPLSVRRAYTTRELLGLVRAVGLEPVSVLRDPFRHRIAIAARPPATG